MVLCTVLLLLSDLQATLKKMTNSFVLSEGSVRQFYIEGQSRVVHPILQILSTRKITQSDRYRIVVSDGVACCPMILPAHMSQTAENTLLPNSVVVIKSSAKQKVGQKFVIVATELEVLGNPGCKYGNPQIVDETVQQPAPAQAPQGQVPVQAQQLQEPKLNSQIKQNEQFGTIFPISSLNPYLNKWTIQARVSQKSDIRTWNNQKGEGKLFSVTFTDKSGDIKATAFNDQVDSFYHMLEEGKVYYVTEASIRPAKKNFSNVNNDYEISFDNKTKLIYCDDGSASNIPAINYNFNEIAKLPEISKDVIVDIIAIVKEASELQQIVAKATNRQLTKRELTLIDRSNSTVKLTLWGTQAEQFTNGAQHPVVAFKGLRVSDFGGRSLSTGNGTSMQVNPDLPQAHALRGWFDSVGQSLSVASISGVGGQGGSSQRKCLEQIVTENLGQKDKPDYFSVIGTVGKLNGEKTIYYTACPGENCSKKVTSENGQWRCEKCHRTYAYCEYRYIFTVSISDYSGVTWGQCFNDIGTQILGVQAQQLATMKDSGNTDAFDAVLAAAAWKTYNFKIRAKQENYNDEMRVRCSVMGAEPVDYVKESVHLLEQVQQLQ